MSYWGPFKLFFLRFCNVELRVFFMFVGYANRFANSVPEDMLYLEVRYNKISTIFYYVSLRVFP